MNDVDFETRVDARYRDMGRARPRLAWSKFEIVLGLLATRLAFELPSEEPSSLAASILLFVLGGYLALAGHRSHLYDAMLRSAASRPAPPP